MTTEIPLPPIGRSIGVDTPPVSRGAPGETGGGAKLGKTQTALLGSFHPAPTRRSRRVVSAFIATAFAQDDAEAASAQWRRVADQLRPKVPKLAVLMDGAEPDVLA